MCCYAAKGKEYLWQFSQDQGEGEVTIRAREFEVDGGEQKGNVNVQQNGRLFV